MEKKTEKQKKAHGGRYYKEKVGDFVTNIDNPYFRGSNGMPSEYRRAKVNFDLFNNKINLKELDYVCKPYGDVGKLPAKMTNKDISSGKIKTFIGMESKKPFFLNYVAVNSEATTRKEQKEAEMMKQYVYSQVMAPIKEQIEIETAQELKGRELSEEEKQQVQQQVQQELKQRTPKEIKKYMEREYQDPAEVQLQHIANYLTQYLNLKRKYEVGLKYLALVAKEVYYVGILNKQTVCWNVNSINFRCRLSERSPYIEDGDSAACDYFMSIADIQEFFGDELTSTELNKIYKLVGDKKNAEEDYWFADDDTPTSNGLIKVSHYVWKDLRDIQILYYLDEEGEVQKRLVNSDYVFNEANGDVSLEKEWIVETYQTWRIGDDIYKKMGPVNNQIKDRDNPNASKLPYYGAVCDNMNSEPTSIMDRLAPLQHYFNIIMYRLELMISSDKGKKIISNIKNIPDQKQISLKQWHYIFESSPFMYVDLNQEGSHTSDVNSAFKVVDLSLASDISKYVELASFVKKLTGDSTGIPEQAEGQIGPDEAVNNVKQTMIQTLHIIEPYYKLHNQVKRNVLEACVETAKICWNKTKPEKLAYILDDMSKLYFDLDLDLLNNNTVGIFIADNVKTEEIKDSIRQLTHAAMQNNKAELSDVLSVLRDESLDTIEETLKVAESEKREEALNIEKEKGEQQKQIIKLQEDKEQKAHERELEEIRVKEKERRITEIIKTSLLGASFNPDKDNNSNNINDFLEVANAAAEKDLRIKELRIKEKQVENENKNAQEKNKIEEQKVKKIDNNSNNNK